LLLITVGEVCTGEVRSQRLALLQHHRELSSKGVDSLVERRSDRHLENLRDVRVALVAEQQGVARSNLDPRKLQRWFFGTKWSPGWAWNCCGHTYPAHCSHGCRFRQNILATLLSVSALGGIVLFNMYGGSGSKQYDKQVAEAEKEKQKNFFS